MMTESEAKQRWCPLVRFKSRETGSGPAFNRYDGFMDHAHPDIMCIGSKCMAWRGKTELRNVPPDPADILMTVDVGYCGAFGSEPSQ